MRNVNTKEIAICGVTAALTIVIMSLGTLVPFATYVCPVLCILLGNTVLYVCKDRLAWTWYAAVAILSCVLCPDKEAVLVYVLLGYYPYIKKVIDKKRLQFIIKLVYFNVSAWLLYAIMIYLLGVDEFVQELKTVGLLGGSIILLLANFTFIILDMLLSRFRPKC